MPAPAPTRGQWRALLLLGAVVLLALALLPFKIEEKSGFAHGDKIAHVAAFACLAFAACRAWAGRPHAVVLGLLAYGVAIEILQTLTPLRSASLTDVVADLAGAVLGVVLARTLAWGRAG